ncbi:MAG: Uma2 family endonuclease [Cyanobacteriota bacterium]|nr:Uma2 family endonuclease [Cyanobacteriota bacterium]
MTLSQNYSYLSPEAYLEAEKNSPQKHEYIQGQIYAMAGASDAHVTITANVVALLRNHIRGTNCRVYMTDMKAKIESLNIFYYPDVMVTCDQRDRNFDYYKRYPCLIVEVLSDTTEAFDRGDKFADYSELETLTEYVLINQKRLRVERFCRDAAGQWILYRYKEGDELNLESIDFRCPVAAVYEDVSFAPREEEK